MDRDKQDRLIELARWLLINAINDYFADAQGCEFSEADAEKKAWAVYDEKIQEFEEITGETFYEGN